MRLSFKRRAVLADLSRPRVGLSDGDIAMARRPRERLLVMACACGLVPVNRNDDREVQSVSPTRGRNPLVSSMQHNDRSLDKPCKLCGAPVGMTCTDWYAAKQVSSAFDLIEETFTTPEELSAQDRMDRAGVIS
jgi:hypothetical protein